MKHPFISLGICSVSVLALAAASASRPASAKDDITFAGKRVTMTIGQSAGGGTDRFGRLLGRTLVRHLPGKPSLIVINQPGAGGVVSMKSWFIKAKPDGLSVTIGAQSQTDPAALQRTHAKYDPAKLKFVGGLAAPSQALIGRNDAVKRLHDKSAKPVVMGVVGSTLRSGNYQVLWGAAFLGWNVKWVHGYRKTSGIRAALERGEVDMFTFGSVRDIKYLKGTGKMTVVSQSGYIKDGKRVGRAILGKAPILADLVKGKIKDPLAQKAFAYSEAVGQIGRWLALPPGTPDKIVAVYVKAFNATLKDPKYVSVIKKTAPDSPLATKESLEKLHSELDKVSPEVLGYIQGELKRQGFGSKK